MINEYFNLIQKNIDILKNLYTKFSSQFYSKTDFTYPNLNKITVTNFMEDIHLFSYLQSYRVALEYYIIIDFELVQYITTFPPCYEFRYRTKLKDSLDKKINALKHKEGHFYVSKSINDLFGARITLPNFHECEQQIYNYYSSKNDTQVKRCYIRNDKIKNDQLAYHGLHLYISTHNIEFPWELQIWDTNNKDNNMKLHAAHELQKEKYD